MRFIEPDNGLSTGARDDLYAAAALTFLLGCCAMACAPTSIANEADLGEEPSLLAQLDDDREQVRLAAVERLRQYLQVPVISAEGREGCFSVEAPPGLECSEQVEFCREESARFAGGNRGRRVVWVYPKDPEEFEDRGFRGEPMPGMIPGGIPLLERRYPGDEQVICGQVQHFGVPGRLPEETVEEAEQRIADQSNHLPSEHHGVDEACLEELADQRQEVRCDVVFVNPCRNEAFLVCQGHDMTAGNLGEIDLPRDELLRVTWRDGTEELSAIFTVDIEPLQPSTEETATQ